MNRKQRAILWCLTHHPGMRGPELCEVTGIWRTNIYFYLSGMEYQGIVRREISRHDSDQFDVIRFYATELGKAQSNV